MNRKYILQSSDKTDFEVGTYTLPLSYSFKNERGAYNSVQGLSVKISAGKFTGYGVSMPLAGHPKTGDLRIEMEDMKAMLKGNLNFRPMLSLKTNPLSLDPKYALPAETAIMDILTQSIKQPFSYFINRKILPATHIPVTGLLPRMPLPNLKDEILRTFKAGHKSFKLKVGDPSAPDLGVAEDIERIKEVRDLISDLPLSLDANGAYNSDTAQEILELFEPYNISYIEEPVRGISEMVELTKTSPIEIAVDESCETMADLDALTTINEIGIIVIKPSRFNNLFTLYLKTERLLGNGKRVIISSAMDGDIGLARAAHFASMLNGCEENPAGFDTTKLYAVAANPQINSTKGIPVLNGFLNVPQGHGLGILV